MIKENEIENINNQSTPATQSYFNSKMYADKMGRKVRRLIQTNGRK